MSPLHRILANGGQVTEQPSHAAQWEPRNLVRCRRWMILANVRLDDVEMDTKATENRVPGTSVKFAQRRPHVQMHMPSLSGLAACLQV